MKGFVGRHSGAGGARAVGQAVGRHLRYLAREGMGVDGTEAGFYGENGPLDRDSVHATCAGWENDRHHFRLIISPEHGEQIEDMDSYVRSLMKDLASDLREPRLDWVAINHCDTGHPHAHVLIRGRRTNGRDLVIPRRVMSHGIRERAEARAQELLGDQSRSEAERGLFGRAKADRWTDIDARLSAIADRNGGLLQRAEIDRRDVFGAVTRVRVTHLQKLGLIAHTGSDGVRFAEGYKGRLDGLQAAQDQIRSHWAIRRQEAFLGRSKAASSRSVEELALEAKGDAVVRIDAAVQGDHPVRLVPQRPAATAPANHSHDVTAEQLTPLDVELMRRGQLRSEAPLPTQYSKEIEALLGARADHLVRRGDAVRQRHGLGFQPEAWARLRDQEAARAIQDQLGFKPDGRLSYGRSDGVVAGTITTSLGRHAVIDRGVGLSLAPIPAGQELAIGHVIGQGLGIER